MRDREVSRGMSIPPQFAHQNDFGLVEFLLNLHNRVCLLRVLVLDDVILQRREIDQLRFPTLPTLTCFLFPCRSRHFGRELVQDLVQEGEGDAHGVVEIGDDDAGDIVCSSRVDVCGVVVLLNGLTLTARSSLGDGAREEVEKFGNAVRGGEEASQ